MARRGPVLRGPFVLRDFRNAAGMSERGKSRFTLRWGAALGKGELWFLWQEEVLWG